MPSSAMNGQVPTLFLAPMAGVTNTVFRRICRKEGAATLTSEFVSADGIFHRNARTREYLEFHPIERPFGVQLFGAEPDRLAGAARMVADWVAPDFIDLNFGCPVNKVVCKNGGSALLRDCPLLAKVASAVVRAVEPLPVTAKIRIGWDARSVNATETARLLEDCGIHRIAVHGRTKEQGYSGLADWDVIAEVVAAVKIPVIGNGDIDSPDVALHRWRESGAAGLMIGRAAMTGPWIFRRISEVLAGRADPGEPAVSERWHRILAHCREEVRWRGEESFAIRAMRSRLMAYSRGMTGGKFLREQFARADSLAFLEDLAADYLQRMPLAA
jgi:tRNA-dihydrouridine synthase B